MIDAIENGAYKRVLGIMPRRCLHGDTQILLPGGKTKKLRDIKAGDKVLSFDGSSVVEDTVVAQWKTNLRYTFKATGVGQLPIISTADHRFAINGKESCDWLQLERIKDERVLVYSGYEPNGLNDPLLGEFMGYMLFGGSDNAPILAVVERLMEYLFYKSTLTPVRERVHDYLMGIGDLTPDEHENYIHSNKDKLLGALWELDNQSIEAFFKAAIYSQRMNLEEAEVKEITFDVYGDNDILWGLYWLLRRIGLQPNAPDEDNYSLVVSDPESLMKLEMIVKVELDLLNKEATATPRYCGMRTTAISMKKDKRIYVYDIETEKHHNFFANGYLVHNSGKDLTAWNIAIRQCIRKPCTVYYCLPAFNQSRRVIWDALDSGGRRFL